VCPFLFTPSVHLKTNWGRTPGLLKLFYKLLSVCLSICSYAKKFAEIWLQLYRFVHYEIVYFLLYYTLYSRIFSFKIWISDLWVPSERTTLGGQSDTNWSLVQEKSTHHFDNKETQHIYNTSPMATFDNSNKFIHISWHVWVTPDLLPDSYSPILSDSNKP